MLYVARRGDNIAVSVNIFIPSSALCNLGNDIFVMVENTILRISTPWHLTLWINWFSAVSSRIYIVDVIYVHGGHDVLKETRKNTNKYNYTN